MYTRALTLTFLAGLALAPACGDKDDTSDSVVEADADADADSDSDTDADTDSDTDADMIESVTIEASTTTLDTRQTVTFSLTGTYASGSTEDLTADATFTSGDTDALQFYAAPEGQPLDGGTVTVTGSHDGLEDSVELTLTVAAPVAGELLFNELLLDGAAEGDPNGDGTLDPVDDEFIEIVNDADVSLDLSGLTIEERDFPGSPRHTFPADTTLKAGEAVVVFGGGDASSLSAPNVHYLIAQASGSLEVGLGLSNDGDRVALKAADGTELAVLIYGTADLSGNTPAASDASLQRSPDRTGTTWEAHDGINGSSGAYSPGTLLDGSEFGGPDSVFGG